MLQKLDTKLTHIRKLTVEEKKFDEAKLEGDYSCKLW